MQFWGCTSSTCWAQEFSFTNLIPMSEVSGMFSPVNMSVYACVFVHVSVCVYPIINDVH